MTALQRPLRSLGAIGIAAAFLSLPALAADKAQVTVLNGTPGNTLVRCELNGFSTESVDIAGASHLELSVDDEGVIREVGAPQLPRVCRSVIIPDDATMTVRVLDVEYHDIPGVLIAPSKGSILRTQDPASIPYTFGPEYEHNAWFPAQVVTQRDPYVLRDVRGMVIEVNAFQYNPVTQVLRVYDEVTFSAVATGPGAVNVYDRALAPDRTDSNFRQIQKHHFINSGQLDYSSLSEVGDMLIISHGAFMPSMQPFMDWKNSTGINTTITDVAAIGNNVSAIKAHIQGVFDSSNLAFVLLVGDIAEIKSSSYSGGASDPDYSLMGADWYPDVLVGRFSASNAAQVNTQVQRSVEYEQMNHHVGQGGWNARSMGIASNQGPGHYGEYDNQHMDLVRADLLAYGFTSVDQIYDPTGTKTQISNGLNAGRRMINYCGHGSTTSWGTTGFSNTNINALTNDNQLPIIHSVACVNGNFSYGSCFGETWLRATNGSEPTGAAGAYMSSINQYWDEPMYAQDETIDLFCAEAYWSLGALWFAGSCDMMDICGQSGRDMFQTWILFGDPSLQVHNHSACPPPVAYCTPGTSGGGCAATVSASGMASATAATGFVLTADDVEGSRNGLFFFGVSGRQANSWGNGTSFRCVVPPVARGDLLSGNGTGGQCNGSVSQDLNALWAAKPAKNPGEGAVAQAQFWYRDPLSTSNRSTSFSDAIEFTVCP